MLDIRPMLPGTLQFSQQLATQHRKMDLLQLPWWGVVARCNAIWETCSDLCRESLAKLATGEPRSVVGRIDKEIRTLAGKLRYKLLGCVTLCNGGCKLLRLLRKVELDSTSCNVARNKKRRVASSRGTMLHRAILQRSIASCWKNCTAYNRALRKSCARPSLLQSPVLDFLAIFQSCKNKTGFLSKKSVRHNRIATTWLGSIPHWLAWLPSARRPALL